MKKVITAFLLMLSLNSSDVFASQTRTFSCNGGYDGVGADFPIASIHFDASYEEAKEGTLLELAGEDSKVILTGTLSVKGSQEFLKVAVILKDSGMVIFNNNSQLGNSAQGKFNFVGVWLENLGVVEVNGKQVFPKFASFQCQTYRD